MIEKIVSYLMLVFFNWYFVIGVSVGMIAKGVFGGKPVSLITGVVVGFIIYDIFRHWMLK